MNYIKNIFKSSSMDTIPIELIDLIFGYIGNIRSWTLLFVCKKFYLLTKNKWNIDKYKFINDVAKTGEIELFKWSRQNGCEWDSDTCSYAAENGHLEVLQWARQNECKWDYSTCAYAAKNGHLEVLQWARQNGCEWDSNTYQNAINNKHFKVAEWCKDNECPI